jgi:peptidoglycan/LPS O-acetylase OafA/YrhL
MTAGAAYARTEVGSDSTDLRYRPALDGLRAVAVLAVLLYHGNVPWVRGGFLGVDVFFVLSGYLITSLLLTEWDRWGAVDLAAFWMRRARRLLPALVLVLTAVLVYSMTAAAATQRDAIRGDAVATLLYVSNWRYVLTGQSYFAQFETPSPLLHTWSLGIEEQWYIVFPIVLAILLARLRLRRRTLGVVLLLAAIGSAAWMAALYTPFADPSRVYYGTDTRVQALLLGAALAVVLAAGRRPGRRTTAMLQGGGLLGAVVLVAAFALVQETQPTLFRGGFLVVAVASGLVVAAIATSDRGPLARPLSWRPVVAVGLVSYGIYLWHWPVYVLLTPQQTGISGAPLLLLRLFVTGVMATVSYVFVEQPVRRVRLTAGSRLVPALAGACAAVLALCLVTSQLAPQSASAAPSDSTDAGPGAAQAPAAPGAAEVFLLGDSVAFNLRSDFPSSTYPALQVTGSTQLGCGLVPDQLEAEGKIITPGPDCVAWHQRIATEVAQTRPKVGVLLVGSWEQYDRIVDGRLLTLGTPAFEKHMDTELAALLDTLQPATRPVAVMNVPCHRTPDFGVGPEPHIVNDENRVRELNAIIARFVASQGPSVHLLDFHGFLCQHGYTTTMNGVTLRTDGLHFTPDGAHVIWGWLAPQLQALAAGAASLSG